MADIAGDCLAAFCAVCCICCSDSLQNWCLFKKWGSGSSSGSGCCTSCCKSSFDDDDFEKEEARLHADALAREQQAATDEQGGTKRSQEGVVNTQPAAGEQMGQPIQSSGGVRPHEP